MLLSTRRAEGSHTILHLIGYTGDEIEQLLNIIYSNDNQVKKTDHQVLSVKNEVEWNDASEAKESGGTSTTVNVNANLVSDFNTSVKATDYLVVENDEGEETKVELCEDDTEQGDEMNKEGGKISSMYSHIEGAVRDFECPMCDNVFEERRYLMAHKRKYHLDSKVFNCKIDNKTFNSWKTLDRHFADHHKPPLFNCKNCDYKCGNTDSIYQHIKYHKPKDLSCDLCEFKTNLQNVLKNHMNFVHKKQKIDCNQCDKTFTNQSSLYCHKKFFHEAQRLYCTLCPFKTVSRHHLKVHIGSEHEGSKFDCEKCDYTTHRLNTLKMHEKTVHLGIRFICELCSKQYNSNGELKRHKLRKHMIN